MILSVLGTFWWMHFYHSQAANFLMRPELLPNIIPSSKSHHLLKHILESDKSEKKRRVFSSWRCEWKCGREIPKRKLWLLPFLMYSETSSISFAPCNLTRFFCWSCANTSKTTYFGWFVKCCCHIRDVNKFQYPLLWAHICVCVLSCLCCRQIYLPTTVWLILCYLLILNYHDRNQLITLVYPWIRPWLSWEVLGCFSHGYYQKRVQTYMAIRCTGQWEFAMDLDSIEGARVDMDMCFLAFSEMGSVLCSGDVALPACQGGRQQKVVALYRAT